MELSEDADDAYSKSGVRSQISFRLLSLLWLQCQFLETDTNSSLMRSKVGTLKSHIGTVRSWLLVLVCYLTTPASGELICFFRPRSEGGFERCAHRFAALRVVASTPCRAHGNVVVGTVVARFPFGCYCELLFKLSGVGSEKGVLVQHYG